MSMMFYQLFQSTLLCKERLPLTLYFLTSAKFQSTLLCKERLSIHIINKRVALFQSTLLCKERPELKGNAADLGNFNPRSYVRSDVETIVNNAETLIISIHAPM